MNYFFEKMFDILDQVMAEPEQDERPEHGWFNPESNQLMTLTDINPKLWDDIRIHVETRCEPIRIIKFIQKPDKLIVFFWVKSSCMFTKSLLSYKMRNEFAEKVEDEFGETLEFINIFNHG